jgi:hypothetical protein
MSAPGPEGAFLRSIHRRDGNCDFYFVANVADSAATLTCSFPVAGKQPELWDPVWGTTRDLPDFKQNGSNIEVPLTFAPAQSYFIVFQKGAGGGGNAKLPNFPDLVSEMELAGARTVSFDPAWGGPQSATFNGLEDWTQRLEPGIRYYSGSAAYSLGFSAAPGSSNRRRYLDLGVVKHLAAVKLNGTDLGVLWTAPWRVEITGALRNGENSLEVTVTNVWANRLIGDEREPPDCVWSPGHGRGRFPKGVSGLVLKRRETPLHPDAIRSPPGTTSRKTRRWNLPACWDRCGCSPKFKRSGLGKGGAHVPLPKRVESRSDRTRVPCRRPLSPRGSALLPRNPSTQGATPNHHLILNHAAPGLDGAGVACPV